MARRPLRDHGAVALLSTRADDDADQAARGGPLPRALLALSSVLTGPPCHAGQPGRPVSRARSPFAGNHRTRSTMPHTSQIDPRGPQFTAALTAVVLAVVLLTAPSPFGTALLAVQAVLFVVGVWFGLQRGPRTALCRRVVRPRLAAPDHLEA